MKRAPHIEVFQQADGQYRWRIRAANGRILNDNYKRKAGVDKAASSLAALMPGVKIVDKTCSDTKSCPTCK